jgi:hypothetical protein
MADDIQWIFISFAFNEHKVRISLWLIYSLTYYVLDELKEFSAIFSTFDVKLIYDTNFDAPDAHFD